MGITATLRWVNPPPNNSALQIVARALEQNYGVDVTRILTSYIIDIHSYRIYGLHTEAPGNHGRPTPSTQFPTATRAMTTWSKRGGNCIWLIEEDLTVQTKEEEAKEKEKNDVVLGLNGNGGGEGQVDGLGLKDDPFGMDLDAIRASNSTPQTQSESNPVSAPVSEQPPQKPSGPKWTIHSVSPPSDLIPYLQMKSSPFLRLPVAKSVEDVPGAYANVANMTSSTTTSYSSLASNNKRTASAANPALVGPQLIPLSGAPLVMDVKQFDINLNGVIPTPSPNPNGGSSGQSQKAEWTVRLMTLLNGGVFLEVEYGCLNTFPPPPYPSSASASTSSGDPLLPQLLTQFLQSLIPTYVQPAPSTYFLSFGKEEWEEVVGDKELRKGWIGEERDRRAGWMVIRSLRGEGLA